MGSFGGWATHSSTVDWNPGLGHEKADTHIAESPNVGALLIQVFHKARA